MIYGLCTSFSCLNGSNSISELRCSTFYGTSENAVKTQIWIAVSMYVLVAIARKRFDLEASLYQTLQILSVNLFERPPISQALEPLEIDANLLSDPNHTVVSSGAGSCPKSLPTNCLITGESYRASSPGPTN